MDFSWRMDAKVLLLVVLLIQACMFIPALAGQTETTAFFKGADKNGDDQLSKKEFYESIMEDEFEELATAHSVNPTDLEFELSDLDGDRKVSLEEWDTIFFSQLTEEPLVVETPPPAEAAPPSTEPPVADAGAGGVSGDSDLMTEEEFFYASDLDSDGKLNKKEFYNAIMEQVEIFEKLSVVEAKNRKAHDMDFVNFDTDEDARVSLAEWNAGLFHEKPQKPAFSDGASFGLVDTSVKRKPMVIDGKIVSPTGAVYYTASDATWVEVEKYCASRQHVLCPLESTCPHTSVAGPWHGGLHTWVDKDAAEGRWMPLQGKEHTWVELKTCGLARFRDDRAHPGLIACCDSEGNPMEIDDAAKERIQKEAVAKAAAAERMAEDAFAEAWEDSSVVGLGNEEKIKKTAEGTEEKKEKKASKNDETAAAAAAAAAAADVQRGAEDGEGGETVEEKKVGAGPKVEDQAKASTAGKIEIQKDGPGDGETGGTAGGVDGAGGSAMDADKQLQREMEMLKKARKARKEKEQAASGGATGTEGGGKKKKDKKKKKKKAAQGQAL